MALTDNIISYYKLDGNSNDSVGSNNGTDTNISYVNGKIEQSASLNNSHSSQITFGTQQTITTLSFWCNLTQVVDGTSGYTLFRATSPDHTLQAAPTTGKILIYDGSNRTANNTWITGSWVNYVFVYTTSGGNGYNIYLNGSFLEKLSTGGQLQFNQIGRSGNFSMEGYIDEIGIWSRALTTDEITELYNNGSGLQYPFSVETGNIKKLNGILWANLKKVNGIAVANINKINGI